MSGESSASGPVVFKPLAAGREAVMLGLVQVGEIIPLQDQRKHRASYRIMLPDCAAVAWRPVVDIDAARRGVLHHINDWLNAADLRPSSPSYGEGVANGGNKKPNGWGGDL